MSRLINEFIGTFFLVFVICVAAVYGLAGDYAPLAIGFVLIAVICAGGHLSKAHYNPAVSLAFWIRGGYLSLEKTLQFIGVQFLAAIAATLVAMLVFSDGNEVTPVSLEVAPALVAEFLFTFLLVWVIMNVATAKALENNQFYGIAIGFAVIGGIYTVGGISMSMLNPAVAGSLALIGKLSITQLWIPVVGSLAGASAAVMVFRLTESRA